ncbi:MAG TPA: methyltransferase domain-containing protein [Acidimicrobiales bacterium]|nr:methyltransferase domain-containing protein [Acidimicrobiales bacterium]
MSETVHGPKTMAKLHTEKTDTSHPPSAVPAAVYDQSYYDSYGARDESGAPIVRPYRRGTNWDTFFAHIADCIVDRLRPATVLDAGCAIGLLVEALRDRGVDASGFDLSEWAISQVPEALAPYCRVGSLAEEIDGRYDLITCIEVIEHLPAHEAPDAIANICRHTDTVLFSSTSDDFEEPTHMNVQPPDYWVSLFAARGLYRDVRHDASYVVPHAMLFRRRQWGMEELAEHYDRAWWQLQQTLLGVQATNQRLVTQLEEARVAVAQLQPALEVATEACGRAEAELADLQRRHDALVADQASPERIELAKSEEQPWWIGHETFLALQESRDRFARERDESRRKLEEALSEQRQAQEHCARAEMELAELRDRQSRVAPGFGAGSGDIAKLSADSEELERLRRTKLLRYTSAARRLYGRLLRGSSP